MYASGIYVILNRVNGHMYVGSSYDIEHRWRKHREALRRGKHHSAYLQRAWTKYGERVFTFIMVEFVEPSMNQQREQEYLNTARYVYNTSKNARSPTPAGSRVPEAWRLAAARGYREKFLSRVLAGQIPHPQTGRVHTEEHRRKVSNAKKEWWSKVDRVQQRAKMAAGIDSAQRADSARKLWADPVYRERAIASRKGRAFNKGYRCTPEQIENRKRAARISNMKRNHGDGWRVAYAAWYPERAHEVVA
jgi:group I intron endonuclease